MFWNYCAISAGAPVHWGRSQRFPDAPADLSGPTSKGREGKGWGIVGGKGKVRRGKVAIHTKLHRAITPKFKLHRHFCTMYLPPSFVILCLLVRKLSCWQTNKQTNRRRWKHPTFFAMLRCWITTRDNLKHFYLPNPSHQFNFSPCNLCTVS